MRKNGVMPLVPSIVEVLCEYTVVISALCFSVVGSRRCSEEIFTGSLGFPLHKNRHL